MKFKIYALVIALVHFVVFATIVFNIPILRQFSLFIYLLFMPGFVFLAVFKVGKINLLDLILFSVGLSIALVMFVGLLINEIYPLFGISQPLSTIPVFLTMSSLTLVLFVVGCRRNIAGILSSISFDNLAQIPVAKAALLMLLPAVSVTSVVYVREAIPVIPIVIAALFIVCVLSSKIIPEKLYPLLLFAISLSLVLQFPFMSKHIVGTDAPLEFYIYKLTAIGERWQPVNVASFAQQAYNSMLSITILPAVYSDLLNVDGELLFKVLFPVVFSFVPVIIYRILSKERWNLAALLSVFFLVSGSTVFYGVEPLSLNRQIVGAFFLLLSVFLLVKPPFSTRINRLLIIIFGAALAVSHYSLTIIYLLFLVLVFVFAKIKKKPESALNGGTVLLLFAITFSWYYFASTGIPGEILTLVNGIVSNFRADFLNNGARPTEIFSTHPIQTFASSINWTLFIIAHFFVVIGIIAIVLNKQDGKLDFKYRIMVLFCSIILFLSVAIPNLSATLNFSRFYAITFLFLAPCFVFGVITLFQLFKMVPIRITKRPKGTKKRVNAAMLLIVVVASAYFLSQYGFINHFAGGSSLSYTLDWNRMMKSNDPEAKTQLYFIYTPEQDIASAIWLSKSMKNSSVIYSDFVSAAHPLRIYGLISDANLLLLTNETILGTHTYLYLRSFNVVSGLVNPSSNSAFNTTELSSFLNDSDCVYTNGDSNVYAPPTT